MSSNKKNICFAINSYERGKFSGGKEKFTSIIIDRFIASNKFLINIICNRTNTQTKPDGINELVKRLEQQDYSQKYDLILSDGIISPLKFLNADFKATYLHDFSLKELRKRFGLYKKLKYYIIPKHLKRIQEQKNTVKQFDKIFVVSQKIKNDIVENLNVNPDNVIVIYPGLDDYYKKNKLRNYPDKTFIFGLSAPNFKSKGGYIFFEALKMVKRNNPNFKAIIIIPKPKERFFIRMLVKLTGLEKQVELLSKPKNLDKFYENIDCLCLPSLVETFGMVALEAMGNGIPVIVSDICGCSEVINHLENGLTFEHKQSKNLADMMLKLINNSELYKKISINSCKTANNFSWDNVYDEILKNFPE